MTRLLYKTKGDSEPGRKPKVYFSCLPEDFEMTFEAVCEDLFKTQDCVIFYKEDMADELSKETREIDLGRMNLFVFPVTFGMLRDEESPVNDDLAFADRERKPVLPIMFERNVGDFILELYGRKFGERQYLSKFSNDVTEIGYADKLRKYLEITLIGDEMAERIRKAFDAYVFLSYRKKDRKYANELMRLIHRNPMCRDIAIWFDEFLTPGESFNASIEKALKDSRMVTLLVTPSLLENDAQGNKNYVQQVEYPNARLSGKPILPAEKVHTDREELAMDYDGLPEIVDANDEEKFQREFLKALNDVAKHEKAEDPTHNYLIGLAYLEGIDMEINQEYGMQLVTKAAEDELPEAMKKLYQMYAYGVHVPIDFKKANEWAGKIYQYYLSHNGGDDPETLSSLHCYAMTFEWILELAKAAELFEKCYEAQVRVLGADHPETLVTQGNLAYSYSRMGKYKEAAEIAEKCYEEKCRVLGEEHKDTLESLSDLAFIWMGLGDIAKAIELQEKTYELSCRVLGMEDLHTLNFMGLLAVAYGELGIYHKQYETAKQCYEISRRVLGEEHPNTLGALCTYADGCRNIENFKKAMELDLQCHETYCRLYEKDHPDMISILSNLSLDYCYLGDHEKEFEYSQRSYEIGIRLMGEDHPDVTILRANYAVAYSAIGKHEKALEYSRKNYEISLRNLGEEHPRTLWALNGLGCSYGELGDDVKALECFDKCYEIRRRVMGEDYPETLMTLSNLACTNRQLGDYEKAVLLGEKCYEAAYRVFGEQGRNTLLFLKDLAGYHFQNGEKKKAMELYSKLHETLCRIADGKLQEELDQYGEMIEKLSAPEDIPEMDKAGEELIGKVLC